MNCTICRTRNTVNEYSITTVTKENITKKQYCKECLKTYSEELNYGDYKTTKLRDTNIDKYNEAINDYRFIPIAFRMKINQQTGEVITFNERTFTTQESLQTTK
tara:strand:- start:897 stop:1208 length:312 start_codon:yes stop_codon:yes gene_type:complete